MNHIKRFAYVVAAGALSLGAFAVDNPVDYVNPLMGTDSKFALSNGNTVPSIALPWGMNQWIPQT